MWLARLAVYGAIISVSFSAFAKNVTLVGIDGSGSGFIWKDKSAHSEAMKLVGAGVYQTNYV